MPHRHTPKSRYQKQSHPSTPLHPNQPPKSRSLRQSIKTANVSIRESQAAVSKGMLFQTEINDDVIVSRRTRRYSAGCEPCYSSSLWPVTLYKESHCSGTGSELLEIKASLEAYFAGSQGHARLFTTPFDEQYVNHSFIT